METKEYKRVDRSVPTLVRQQISRSLKSYNATHPRGKAADGSEWSQRISNGLRNKYWSKIPKQKNDNGV